MKRQPACDACRARKTKCDGPAKDDGDSASGAASQSDCTACRTLGVPCTYFHVVKKSGPKPRRTNRPIDHGGDAVSINVSTTAADGFARFKLDKHVQARSGRISQPSPAADTTAPTSTGSTLAFTPFLSRSLVFRVLTLHRDTIAAFFPGNHSPTTLADVQRRRECEPGQEEWTTMIVITVGTTIAHLPNHLPELSRREARDIVEQCVQHARSFISHSRPDEEITRDRFIIVVCLGSVAFVLGHTHIARECHGMNVALLFDKQLHLRSTYATMSPMDREYSKRAWWLAYSTDRSAAMIEGSWPLMNEDLIDDLDLPEPYGEEATDHHRGVLLQGHVFNVKQWKQSSWLLRAKAQDRKVNLSVSYVLSRLGQIDTFVVDMSRLLSDCPLELQLGMSEMGDEEAAELLPSSTVLHSRSLRGSPNPDGNHPQSLSLEETPREYRYALVKANLYITEQALLFVALQYREDLMRTLVHLHASPTEVEQMNHKHALDFRRARLAKTAVLARMLRIIHHLPIDALSSTTLPGLLKIRYVASSLLNDLELVSPGPSDGLSDDDRIKAAHYLSEYLAALSKIESAFSMTED